MRGRILDLGSSIGHLTTYYGLRSVGRHVVGCDFSRKSVGRAIKEAKRRKLANVSFEVCDITQLLPAGNFDVIASTQVLADVSNRREVIDLAVRILSPTGIIVSVEALGTAHKAAQFIQDVSISGLKLVNFRFVYFSDLGERGCYPMFTFARSSDVLEPHLEDRYALAIEAVSPIVGSVEAE